MAKVVAYKQVELSRTDKLNGALLRTVTHIPSSLAVKGKFIELSEDSKDDSSWEIWQIAKVSEFELSPEAAQKLAKKYHKGFNNNI